MKRKSLGCLFVGVLLLTFLLGMAGCGISPGKNSGGSFLSIERQRISERWEENGQNNVADYSFYTQKADEAFIQVKNRDTAGPYWMNENWLALYKDQILFQNPTLGDGLYLAYAGKDTTPQCILEKGSPIGGYGSVLYACDYSKKCYVAMDLAKGNEWISLQPWDQNVGYAVSDGKNLYYFGMSSDEDGRCYDFFVDVVELDTLQSKRVLINEELGSLVIDEEILYYVRKGESTYELCRAALAEKNEEILCEVDPNVQLHKAGTHIFIYGQNVDPRMYDLETRTVQEVATFHNGQNGIQIVGNIAYGIYGSDESAREWIYDIAAGKEWTKEESILNGWTVFAGHDDVLFCKDSEKEQYYRFLANGIAFEADMSGFENREGFSHITANAQWGVLLTEDSLFSVEVETNTVVHHQWERREVPYDGTDR